MVRKVGPRSTPSVSKSSMSRQYGAYQWVIRHSFPGTAGPPPSPEARDPTEPSASDTLHPKPSGAHRRSTPPWDGPKPMADPRWTPGRRT